MLGVVVLVAGALCAARSLGSLLPLDTEHLHASVGGYAVMNCHLDFPFGHEIPYHLHWDKDGEMIFSWYSGEGRGQTADRWGGRVRRVEPGVRGLGRGSINISAVRETDAGLYRCRVTFPNRTPPARNNGTYYRLEVDGGNLIVTPPMNVTVLEGERAELECLPKDPHSTVEWYREGAPLPPEVSARSELAPNGSLVLRAATSADPALYECRVRAPDDSEQTASAFLDVHYKAKVVYAPKERHFPYGKPASLDCHFSANPPLTNLRWEKDGFLFDPYNVQGVFYSRNGSLLFNQVEESHEGVYSCTPYNALGTEGASPGVRVFVQRPPALRTRPAPLYVARLGAAVTLPCQLAAHDRDDVAILHWTRKDGSALPLGRHSLEDGNLTIAEVSEDDRGVYVCTASNEAAAVSAETELLVENMPPRAPHNLTALASRSTLHLTWVPGHNGLDVEYNVWYRERAVSEWRTMKILTRGATEATLEGLRPGAEYELRVLSQDLIGDGLFSKPLFVRTLDPEISDKSVNAFISATTEEMSTTELGDELQVTVRLLDDGALVRWTRDAEDDTACSLRWYRLPSASSPASPASPALQHQQHTREQYALVPGAALQEGGEYRARVECDSGAAGSASLAVPHYSGLRGAALGAAGGALLLALAAASLYALRRRAQRRC